VTGVQTCALPISIREYRPPEEVARADSLATLEDVPVTIGHPRGGNAAASSVGHVRGSSIRVDGSDVVGTLIISGPAAVAGIKTKRYVDTSAGYDVDVDPTPGTTPEGGAYDRVQRNIRYDHNAILPPGTGRTGSTMRLDGADQVIDDETPTPTETPMKKIKITRADGKAVEVEVSDEAVAVIAGLEADLTASKARADAQAATLAKHDADAAAAARAALEATARALMGKDFAVTRKDAAGAEIALTDDEIRVAVIKRTDSAFDASKHDAAYLRARFDIVSAPSATSTLSPAAPILRVLNGGTDAARTDAAPTPETDPAGYAAMCEVNLSKRLAGGVS
jgi:hypothetical protein